MNREQTPSRQSLTTKTEQPAGTYSAAGTRVTQGWLSEWTITGLLDNPLCVENQMQKVTTEALQIRLLVSSRGAVTSHVQLTPEIGINTHS